MKRIPVGVLGATGMVGQRYLSLLENHPWFEVVHVAASPQSAGKSYEEAVRGRWQMESPIPQNVKKLVVKDAAHVEEAKSCRFVFSCVEMEKEQVRNLENAYAAAGIPVVSSSSAHRWTEDVPMLIPEINPPHLDVIPEQQKKRGWKRGFIVVKPNCSLQSYLAPIYALEQAGYSINQLLVTTMQAVSGAGYPGVASLDMVDNIVPFIGGEEEKSEKEPGKILGKIENGKIIPHTRLKISAHCNRVPVVDGHTACVSMKFAGKKPTREEIIRIWREFTSVPQELKLPSAPEHPLVYREEENRPQPRKDRDAEKGMAITLGRLRECNVLDYRFVGLSHNTIRGAAGGGILNAELLKAKGFFD